VEKDMTRHDGKYISYLRVSTAKQGESGLGLEAQRAAVENWLNGGRWKLVSEFVEIESGKSHRNRPKLAQALEACRLGRARVDDGTQRGPKQPSERDTKRPHVGIT
jgi:DNA invertase Pin-like site-specific DNA recombinase